MELKGMKNKSTPLEQCTGICIGLQKLLSRPITQLLLGEDLKFSQEFVKDVMELFTKNTIC